MRTERVYLIWSIEHGGWWAPNSMGYTKNVTEAGRYSERDAIMVCNGANINLGRSDPTTRPMEAMVPIDELPHIDKEESATRWLMSK